MQAEVPPATLGPLMSAAGGRPPLRSITLLMPVWGSRFVSQFLEFCLPTLLAAGNIPAIAAMLPCRLVLLSSEADAPAIRAHPAWQALEHICTGEIRLIDDLITERNHTATITLAYARAVRETGDAMLDTCFIFLVSDYLVADGSLKTVVERIRGGASGVVAGNFQVIAEDAIPTLRSRIEPQSPVVSLPARALVKWSLAHLHPTTLGNTVNFGLSHNAHTNRLFWRVDEDTLLGRFYLMHMIGIRPELTDFVVGSSCDYSFIPEMCPSGNVVALADSDEYLVVEMQPRNQEAHWLLPGPIDARALATSLMEWATAEHRGNIANTLVYHANELPPSLPRVVAESSAFVEDVRARLTSFPQPHRNHHYWIGALAWHRVLVRTPVSREDWKLLLGETMPRAGLRGQLWSLRIKLLGAPPAVTRLHPRWPDYGLPLAALRKVIAGNGRTLLVSGRPAAFSEWLARGRGEVYTLEAAHLLGASRDAYAPLTGSFDACFMALSEELLASADQLIAGAGPLLRPGGQILILIVNDRGFHAAGEFSRAFARQSARLLDLSSWVAEAHYVPANRLRWATYRALHRVAHLGNEPGWRARLRAPLLAIAAGGLMLISFLVNLGIRASLTAPAGAWSSVFLILRPTGKGTRGVDVGGAASTPTPKLTAEPPHG